MVPFNLSASMQSTADSAIKDAFAGASSSYGAGSWNVQLGGSGTADFAANEQAAQQPLAASVAAVPMLAWVAIAAAVWVACR